MLDFRWCAGCCADTPHEVPPCEDGHGIDCVDLACAECGMALVTGMVMGLLMETAPGTGMMSAGGRRSA